MYRVGFLYGKGYYGAMFSWTASPVDAALTSTTLPIKKKLNARRENCVGGCVGRGWVARSVEVGRKGII